MRTSTECHGVNMSANVAPSRYHSCFPRFDPGNWTRVREAPILTHSIVPYTHGFTFSGQCDIFLPFRRVAMLKRFVRVATPLLAAQIITEFSPPVLMPKSFDQPRVVLPSPCQAAPVTLNMGLGPTSHQVHCRWYSCRSDRIYSIEIVWQSGEADLPPISAGPRWQPALGVVVCKGKDEG